MVKGQNYPFAWEARSIDPGDYVCGGLCLTLNWKTKFVPVKLSDLHYLKNYPVSVLFKKAVRFPGRKLAEQKKRKRWSKSDPRVAPSVDGWLQRFFAGFSIPPVSFEKDGRVAFLLDAFSEKRFDILGSGWIQWTWDQTATGIEGHHYPASDLFEEPDQEGAWLKGSLATEHLSFSEEVWRSLSERGRFPIDRHRDMKSGFRWPSDRWWKEGGRLAKGKPGADPKVPMELGRFQECPRIPLLLQATDRDPKPYLEEFRDRVLEFIVLSPPGMSIDWSTPMDVGMRIMNLLLAWDLFKELDQDGILDASFESLLLESVHLHARYILDHLEYQDGLTGNHYIFDLLGLLFAGSYVNGSEEADRWMALGIEELIRELFKQFFSDGVNFEASTAYHRLSAEGICWGVGMVMGQKERLRRMGWDRRISLSGHSHAAPRRKKLHSTANEPFPSEFLERLEKAGVRLREWTKPNGRFPQFGDNDSGRAFVLTPLGEMLSPDVLNTRYVGRNGERERFGEHGSIFDEDRLEVLTTNALFEGLFDNNSSSDEIGSPPLEREMVRWIRGGANVRKSYGESPGVRVSPVASRSSYPYEERTELPFGQELDLQKGEWLVRPVSGVHIYRTNELHLCVSAWTGEGLRHTLGHSHGDRFSFELWVAGKDLVVDPGSYIYGALPSERDRFRGDKAHSIPYRARKEQLWWSNGPMGLFYARSAMSCSVLGLEEGELILLMKGGGVRHERSFLVRSDHLLLIDRANTPFQVLLNKGSPHSLGYGKKLSETGRR